jgi:RimJ/RimL family protein N-acetyltransferase
VRSPPPAKLTGARIILRQPRDVDAAVIFQEYAQDPQVTRYLTWKPHQGVEQTQAFLAQCAARWKEETEYTWTITLAGDDRAVGMIACRPREHSASIGYVLARRLWGQGFMSEAVKLVVDWAIVQPTVFRVWAVCDVENAASGRVMEKAGMQREGLLRRWLVHPNVSSEPRDCFVYARVR